MVHKHLNFICPTDSLEKVIRQTFRQENYFYTSLANSVVLNSETVAQINEIIESNNIDEITFYLSRDNEIIKAALRNGKHTYLNGMDDFYHAIESQIQNLSFEQEIEDIELLLITYYLNEKIKELRQMLNAWLIKNMTINALIYDSQNNVFIEANSKLFLLDHFCLN